MGLWVWLHVACTIVGNVLCVSYVATSSPLFPSDDVLKVLGFHPCSVYSEFSSSQGLAGCPGIVEGQQHTGRTDRSTPRDWGSDYCPLISTPQTTPRCCIHCGVHSTRIVLPNWCEFRRGSVGWLGTEALALRGQAAGMGLLQPGEDTASEWLHSSVPVCAGRLSRRRGPAVHGGGWEAQGSVKRGGSLWVRGSFFHCEDK